MAVRKFRPTTPLRREMTMATFEEITTSTPEKSLLASLNKSDGRSAQDKIIVGHHGGGAKRKYRIMDFKRNKGGVSTKVATIEYDPNRTVYIALVVHADGGKRYIVAPVGLKVGDVIVSGPDVDIKAGNALSLKNIPTSTFVHDVELQVGKGAQVVRSAGTIVQLMVREGSYAILRLPSGETRYARIECRAIIGTVSNTTSDITNIGKAGRRRHMGWRPTARGSVMNPNDHLHGGGEGRSPIGRPSPVTPRGKPVLGYKIRKNKKYSDRFIIKRRSDKQHEENPNFSSWLVSP